MKQLLLFVVMVLTFANQSLAHIMTGNQRLDRAIYAKHDPKFIVAGQIVQKDAEALHTPSKVSFRFKIATVILGKETYRGQTLTISATSFMWPRNLVAFQKETNCVLVLLTGWGQNRDEYYLCSVVPVSTTTLPTAKDGEEAKAILAEQLLVVLKAERSANRQRHLIQQVCPILSKDASDVLVPFLKSDDVWLRRAAIAGLVHATKQPQYLTMAHRDIEQFIEAIDPGSTVKGPDSCLEDAALFSHYFFLSVGWSRKDDAAAVAYLPLFRLVAHSKQVPEWTRWEHGVKPLCHAGTREDAKFLYDYCRDRKSKKKQEIFRFSSYRQEIIMGISRILDLGLSNWVESDFLKKEQEQHMIITDALIKEGVIGQRDAHRHPEQGAPADADKQRR